MSDQYGEGPCPKEKKAQWISFLNQAFGYQQNESFGVDFAPLFEDDALAFSHLIYDREKIISSAALYPKTVVTPAGSANIAVIGAVATDPNYQGKGLSQKVIEALVVKAEQANLEGIILWSDRAEHYEKLGFNPVGRQEVFSLHSFPKKILAAGQLQTQWQWQEIENIYNVHNSRLERSPSYWSAIQKITSCAKIQWLDENKKVSAYLGIGKGKDMANIIHEWGGEDRYLITLVSAITEFEKGLYWLTHPTLKDPIAETLKNQEVVPGTSHLGLFKNTTHSAKNKSLPKILENAWFWGLDSL